MYLTLTGDLFLQSTIYWSVKLTILIQISTFTRRLITSQTYENIKKIKMKRQWCRQFLVDVFIVFICEEYEL